jgi:hypothetical protein
MPIRMPGCNIVVIPVTATMLKADSAAELESLMKQHEEKLSKTFQFIDDLANKHKVSVQSDVHYIYFAQPRVYSD